MTMSRVFVPDVNQTLCELNHVVRCVCDLECIGFHLCLYLAVINFSIYTICKIYGC